MVFCELWQIGLQLWFRGPTDSIAQSYLLAMIAAYPILIGFWYGMLALVGGITLKISAYYLVAYGHLSPNGMLSPHTAISEGQLGVIGTELWQTLVAMVIFGVVGSYLGARMNMRA